MTRWAAVPEVPGLEASDDGQVRCTGIRLIRSNGAPYTIAPGPKKVWVGDDGYRRVTYRRRGYLVHCLMLMAFVGPRPERMDGCHTDGDKANNVLPNLRWDTRRNNILDSVRHGTHWASNRSRTQTACKRGHEFTDENTRRIGNRRQCRECERARQRRERADA